MHNKETLAFCKNRFVRYYIVGMKTGIINKRIVFYILSLGMLVFFSVLFCRIPLRSRIYRDDRPWYGAVSFSREPGFYDEPFYLTMDAPEGEIYYTLDGTEPDRSSLKYEKPLYIYDSSSDHNIHSMRDDVSIFFDEDKRELYALYNVKDAVIPAYVPPKNKVGKCMTIKAVCYDSSGNRSDTVTGSYFIGRKGSAVDDPLVISLIMDPDDLFDYEKGIYVLGKIGDEYWDYIESCSDEDELRELLSGRLNANYFGSGREWERQATMQLFEGGRLRLTQQTGIRIQGGYSREFDPKSLRLYAREEYDGNRVIHTEKNYSLCMDKLVIYNGGEDSYGKIKDPLMSDICRDMDFVATAFKPCILYLNGEYWGYLFLTDRFDKRYMQIKYGVDDDNVVLTKYGILKEGTEEDLAGYNEDMLFISTADMTVPENYKRACEIMDVNSLIDYMAAEIYIARWHDWPSNNYALWKSREPESGRYGDCRWRFILFDVNFGGLSYKNGDATRDTIELTRAMSPLLDNMLNNEEFRQAFIKRLLSMRENEFEPGKVSVMIDGYVEMMKDHMPEYYDRFFSTDDSRFYEDIDDLKQFFAERYEYVPEMVEENFGEGLSVQ